MPTFVPKSYGPDPFGIGNMNWSSSPTIDFTLLDIASLGGNADLSKHATDR